MLKKNIIFAFILTSLILSAGCKEEPKQKAEQKKEQSITVNIKQTPEQEELHRKTTESRFKPSSGQSWKP